MTLLLEVTDYLQRTGCTASKFGAFAMRDAGFVDRLREGRQVRAATEARLRGFMAAHPEGPAGTLSKTGQPRRPLPPLAPIGAERAAQLLARCSVRETAVYRAMQRAAARGLEAPTNDVLAGLAGCESSAASAAVRALEAIGLLRVERFACSRVVEIAATGWRTAPVAGGGGVARRRAALIGSRKLREVTPFEAIDETKLPARVDRRPCPACGTRGDLGCKHGRAGVNW